MFECLQVEDYKRHVRGRNARVSSGKCVMRYYVDLNNAGRAIWVRDPEVIWWGTGRRYGTGDFLKRTIKRRRKDLADLPYIQTANHGKLVSKIEAQKLLGEHWLPHAALDHLTEQLESRRVVVAESEVTS